VGACGDISSDQRSCHSFGSRHVTMGRVPAAGNHVVEHRAAYLLHGDRLSRRAVSADSPASAGLDGLQGRYSDGLKRQTPASSLCKSENLSLAYSPHCGSTAVPRCKSRTLPAHSAAKTPFAPPACWRRPGRARCCCRPAFLLLRSSLLQYEATAAACVASATANGAGRREVE